MFEKGTQIAFVPEHVKGDLTHKDVQFGFIMEKANTKEEAYFCRYWKEDLTHLRTTSGSELTPANLLVEQVSVTATQVRRAISLIELGY